MYLEEGLFGGRGVPGGFSPSFWRSGEIVHALSIFPTLKVVDGRGFADNEVMAKDKTQRLDYELLPVSSSVGPADYLYI